MFLSFFCDGYVFAHGDLHKRILKVTDQIKASPDSAYLYFKRGKLYYQHESYKKSIKDLISSNRLGYNSSEQKLLFAKSYFKLEEYENSLAYSENILSADPENVSALKIKAETYLELKNFYESAETFEKVIKYATQTFPQNYIDASIAWELLKDDNGEKRAVSIIQKGIENLGQIISLYNRLIELSIKHKDYDFAITTQLKVLNFTARKEAIYYKLSELYVLNNNNNKALENLTHAKEQFYNLPLRLQNTPFMKELINNIKIKEILLKK